jgi:hypothetical protein
MSKQTALQWFMDKLPHSIETQFSKQIQQALEMEREQMIDAYTANSVIRVRTKAEQYYNETYGG